MKRDLLSFKYKPGFLTPDLSVYLDLMRVLAAVAVLVGHMSQHGLYPKDGVFSGYGHEAVIYFFVLSGIVIANSAFSSQQGWKPYLVARVARIYSVVIPAIIFSFVLKGLVSFERSGELLDEFISNDLQFINLIAPLFFLSESWTIGANIPWNGPFWSLCYEVWFYVFFGLFLFLNGRVRLACLATAALIAGPSILLLFPIWLAGAFLVFTNYKYKINTGFVILLWGLSFFGIFLVSESGVDVGIKNYLHEHVPGYWRLSASQRFVTDYFLMLCVVANIVVTKVFFSRHSGLLNSVKKWAIFFSGFTFSIYIYHFPMVYVFEIYKPFNFFGAAAPVLYFLTILLLCCLLGLYTEKNMGWVRRPLVMYLAVK